MGQKFEQNCEQNEQHKIIDKLDTVPLDKKYPEETMLPEDGLYRHLYQPGEQHEDQKR